MNNVIVSPHHLSTAAGSEIFKLGGNAVDAAIATNLIQGIVAPETCGIGGDLFALIWDPNKNQPDFLDASGYAGSLADVKKLKQFKTIPLNHPLSVTVPGAVAGWYELSSKYGKLKIESILNLGIELCHEGFLINDELYSSLDMFREELSGHPSGYSFYRNNLPIEAGTRIRRPQLGKTLERLRDNGVDYFYKGEIASEISNAVGGAITMQDLSEYQSEWRKPLHQNIFGYDGWTSPPSTQGYLTLSSLKGVELINEDSTTLHSLIESYRIFAADRDNITFDYKNKINNFVGNDLSYIEEKIKSFNSEKSGIFNFPNPHGGGTAYMTTVDSSGLGVSLIQSNFYGIGSRIGVGRHGFFLHNRGCGFNLVEDHPNCIEPRKKPLHTLSPTIWSKNGKLEFIIGTRGGRHQPQLLIQAILPYIKENKSFENIIKLPRWVIDNFESNQVSNLRFENISKETLDKLTSLGHKINNENKYVKGFGPISVIYKKSDGFFEGVNDFRVGTEKTFNSF